MKNVLKRLIELINLFKDDTKISTNKIKDSIPDYRDLNEQAFRRAFESCLLYTSPSPRDKRQSRMPSSA